MRVLIPADTLRRIAAGEVTLAFRRWRRPTVRAGGTLRTAIGVLAIDDVRVVDAAAVTDAEARAAGAADRDDLLGRLRGDGALHRIALHPAGPDPRIALRERAPDAAEAGAVAARLARLDARSPRGPWTRDVLELIAARPEERAADLAARLGRERLPFKADVRKLKELGLTESLEVGYRLSPRGQLTLSSRPKARSNNSP